MIIARIIERFFPRQNARVFAHASGPTDVVIPAFKPQDLENTARLPTSIFCPITNMPMSDPVLTVDGFSYEREAIQRWFSMNKKTSPLTGAILHTTQITSNHSLRNTINELVSQH